jgi:ribonuclease P protein component
LAKQFTLGKKERLKSRKQIEQLFKEGKSFSIFPFKILYIISPSIVSPLPAPSAGNAFEGKSDPRLPTPSVAEGDARLLFGVAVGNRNFKKAVDRNRIKRLTREAYRLQKLSLEQKVALANKQLNIFFIYIGKELPDHLLAKEKTALILNRLIKVVDENTVADS